MGSKPRSPDCASVEGPQGTAAPVQNFLNYGAPASPHDTSGYPKMTAWGHDNLTYEGTYWRWIQARLARWTAAHGDERQRETACCAS